MFQQFKAAFQQHVAQILIGQHILFRTDVDPIALYEAYLQGFPEAERQGHTCNACSRFIRHYGGLVTIDPMNRTHTMWDFEFNDPEYSQSLANLRQLVQAAKVETVFVHNEQQLGIESNVAPLAEGGTTRWHHIAYKLPKNLINSSSTTNDTIRSEYEAKNQVFKRSLDELSINATETVLELIAQNSVYRGEESKAVLEAFLKYQKQYSLLPEEEKVNFVWRTSSSTDAAFITRMRNTAMGTLLEDVSIDLDLDVAVAKFEKIMAPANYKRPNAVVTKKTIEAAEKTIKELGLEDSLARRFANQDDLTVNNVLFVNRGKKKETLLSSLTEDAVVVNPRSFSKVEGISLEKFLADVLPNSTLVEVLFENKHEPNLVSLITAQNSEAPSLFKWDNPFSLSYNGGLADSAMKQNVKAAGGNIDAVLRASLQWNDKETPGIVDFDLHAIEPNGNLIYYGNKARRHASSGMLDVDMINPSSVGIENTTWTELNKMPKGKYLIRVHNFNQMANSGFRVEIEFNGEIHSFLHKTRVTGTVDVAYVTLDKDGNFTIEPLLASSSVTPSKDVWNLSTNRFQVVSNIFYSPNYWGDKGTGNKHVVFTLQGAQNSESVRGFLNEYLKSDLDKHRKVFEALGSKLKVPFTDNQLSGLGFSTTSKNELVVRVTGKTQRTLKVIV